MIINKNNIWRGRILFTDSAGLPVTPSSAPTVNYRDGATVTAATVTALANYTFPPTHAEFPGFECTQYEAVISATQTAAIVARRVLIDGNCEITSGQPEQVLGIQAEVSDFGGDPATNTTQTLYVTGDAGTYTSLVTLLATNGGGGSSDAVLYTVQTLTTPQQVQARANIGADAAGTAAAALAAHVALADPHAQYALESALGTLATQNGTFSGTSSGTNTGDQTNITGNAATVTTNANLTGPVTSTGNATAIANGAITNAMLANAAVANLSGTNTGDQDLSSYATAAAVTAGYQPLDTDLTTIAALTATADNFLQAKSGAWASRTVAQVKTDLALTGTNSGDQTITLTGDVTGNGTGSFAATIAAGTVTGAKIAQAGATSGQVLAWNGTTWAPATSAGGSPGGSSGDLQYNNGGAFAGVPGVSYAGNTTLFQSQAAGAVPLAVQGATSQTAALVQLRNSIGGRWCEVVPNGSNGVLLYVSGHAAGGAGRGFSLAANNSSGTATFATDINAGFSFDDVKVGGGAATEMNYLSTGIVVGRNIGASFSLTHGTYFSDVAARAVALTSATAFTTATTNISGGSFAIAAGNGAASSAGAATGGAMNVTGGIGYGTGNGGAVTIQGGAASGSGARGRVRMPSLPTSAAGLSAGDLWNNAGVLSIV